MKSLRASLAQVFMSGRQTEQVDVRPGWATSRNLRTWAAEEGEKEGEEITRREKQD